MFPLNLSLNLRLFLQESKRFLGILLGKEGDIKAGLHQRQAKQFPLAWAVFDQQDGGMYHHYKEMYRRDCAERE